MDTEVIVTSVTLAMLFLEGAKWLVRLVKKDNLYEFSMKFYYFMLPVLSFAVGPLMALLGYADYNLPADWLGWVRELLRVVVTALASVLLYENSIAKLKNASRFRFDKLFRRNG